MGIPKNTHPHDVEWVTEQLSKLNITARCKAVDGYDKSYMEAADKEPVEHRKENAGRREANTRLRKFVERYSKAIMGHTIRPPTMNR